MNRLGVLVGLAAEARILYRASGGRVLMEVAAADPARARDGAQRLVAGGARALVSFGIAGALDPALGAGTVLLAESVTAAAGLSYATDGDWVRRLGARLSTPAAAGAHAGSDTLLATAAAKRELKAATGALAVDMESHVVAEAAAAAGLPFIVLRAIADGAEADLPHAALLGYAGGRVRPLRAARALIAAPAETLALLRLARDTTRALIALRRLVRLVGGDLLAPL